MASGHSLNGLLCIGHSHVASVSRASVEAGIGLVALNFWEMPGATVRQGAGLRLSDDLARRLGQHRGPVFSMIGGAAHGVLGMLVHPRRFDFVLPDAPHLALDAEAEVLPATAVRRVLESLMADFLSLMGHVREVCPGSLVHVEPPPPYEDAERMRPDIPWPLYPGMLHDISPAPLRYKLWRLHSNVLRDWCRKAGAAFLPCPTQSANPRGFLRDLYYGDGAHANVAYGALVLAQMRQLA
ncbi:hypothetical protein DVT68_09430 [Dyella solisilvae]|uniref:SGNH/GDSL hydrolase family protein n=1 Tax=Dyella solisilvae TaxID=1920168 RepID=A0A370K9L6_9GAMM|nr:hypothetical protein [Dyella solisilvae]RDI98730.1 hypothetical protein DVT68_09430 [Dyella solisilvae]